MSTPYGLVLITAPNGPKAKSIAAALVKERLAACVNVVPGLTSIYRWKGKVETASEALLIVKARKGAFRRIEAFVRKIHPYDVPEIISLGMDRGSAAYLKWLKTETV